MKIRHYLRAPATFLISLIGICVAVTALCLVTAKRLSVRAAAEPRPVVKRHVEELSRTSKGNTGVSFSEEEKNGMVDKTISRLKARGFCDQAD